MALLGRLVLWLLFVATFGLELVKVVLEKGGSLGAVHVKMVAVGYWSSLMVLELVMAGLVIFFFIRYPVRRTRLITLSICHFSTILILPMAFKDWSWAAVLYPWPHTLLAFDSATPSPVFWISVMVGFVAIPLMTLRWGEKAFCNYVCPHGAFFGETYGRCYTPHMTRLSFLGRFLPQLYFLLMAVALVDILLFPSTLETVRSVQKLAYFGTAELFYFVLAVPLIGGRSYCALVCPLGYAIRLMGRAGRALRKEPATAP